MKKNLFLIPILLLISIVGNGQGDSTVLKKWELGISYNSVEAQMNQTLYDTWVFPSANYYGYFGDKKDRSFSVSVLPTRKLNKHVSLRFEIGITCIRLSSYYRGDGDTLTQNQGHIGSTADIIKEDKLAQNIYRIAPSIQYQLYSTKAIETYTGGGLIVGIYSDLQWSDDITETYDPNHYSKVRGTTEGGFLCGLQVNTGIRWNFSKRIAIGGELKYSLAYYNLGGLQTGTYDIHVPSGDEINLEWTIHNNRSTAVQFSKILPSIQISFQL